MKLSTFTHRMAALAALALLALGPSLAAAQGAKPAAKSAAEPPMSFHVINQRTLALTAEYWNPILSHVSRRSGIPLTLKLTKSAAEGNLIAEKAGYDFIYTNQLFTPERDGLGYYVIARPVGKGIQAQIVVPSDSPARTLQDLEGKEVGFVSKDGFAGYYVAYDALLRAKVNVKSVFTGNQEASVAQLKVGKIFAAGVNGLILERYARREGFAYRALWTSELFPDLAIMAHKRIDPEKVAKVKEALITMDKDKEGRVVLAASAALIKANNAQGFVDSNDREYDSYRNFFKNMLVKR